MYTWVSEKILGEKQILFLTISRKEKKLIYVAYKFINFIGNRSVHHCLCKARVSLFRAVHHKTIIRSSNHHQPRFSLGYSFSKIFHVIQSAHGRILADNKQSWDTSVEQRIVQVLGRLTGKIILTHKT